MPLIFRCQYQYASGFSLDVDFESRENMTALVGPSGSGKTTTLALIAGLLRPAAGFIRLDDRVITDTGQGIFVSPEQRRVGLLFQDHCLFPHLSVRRNLEYGLRRRVAGAPDLPHVAKALELSDLLDRQPRTLSGGQMQRIALGRAILCAPQLLLLDEPLTAVESDLREKIMSYIQWVLKECQIPILLVSHNQAMVNEVATRVISLRDGRVDADNRNSDHDGSR